MKHIKPIKGVFYITDLDRCLGVLEILDLSGFEILPRGRNLLDVLGLVPHVAGAPICCSATEFDLRDNGKMEMDGVNLYANYYFNMENVNYANETMISTIIVSKRDGNITLLNVLFLERNKRFKQTQRWPILH